MDYLSDSDWDKIIETGLRTEPLSPLPRDFRPFVMAQIQPAAFSPFSLFSWLDLILAWARRLRSRLCW